MQPNNTHAAAVNDSMQMVIYGGSNSSGLVDDKLWMLHLSEQNEGIWSEVRVVGNTAGPRYGHSLIYLNPLVIHLRTGNLFYGWLFIHS